MNDDIRMRRAPWLHSVKDKEREAERARKAKKTHAQFKGLLKALRLPRAQLAVAHAVVNHWLKYYRSKGGVIHPGISNLAKKASCCDRTVHTTLRYLEGIGVLVRVDESDARSGRATAYSFDANALWYASQAANYGVGPKPKNGRPRSANLQRSKVCKTSDEIAGRSLDKGDARDHTKKPRPELTLGTGVKRPRKRSGAAPPDEVAEQLTLDLGSDPAANTDTSPGGDRDAA
ncbi:MAG: hypothetical protein ROR55_21395 [Devosia sp.]